MPKHEPEVEHPPVEEPENDQSLNEVSVFDSMQLIEEQKADSDKSDDAIDISKLSENAQVIEITKKVKTLKFEDGSTSPKNFPLVNEPFGDSLRNIKYEKYPRDISCEEIDYNTPPEAIELSKKVLYKDLFAALEYVQHTKYYSHVRNLSNWWRFK